MCCIILNLRKHVGDNRSSDFTRSHNHVGANGLEGCRLEDLQVKLHVTTEMVKLFIYGITMVLLWFNRNNPLYYVSTMVLNPHLKTSSVQQKYK
jgi:hypothetical protein